MTPLTEREWSNEFGDHWEVYGFDKAGRLHSQVLTKDSITGMWPGREQARSKVLQSILGARL